MDIRFPTLPVAELQRHQACVNALAWAPHSSCHICTAGDDSQALIWDLSSMSQPLDQGLGALPLHIEENATTPCPLGYYQALLACGGLGQSLHVAL